MNKKKILYAIASIVCISAAFGILVNYLSNTTTVNLNVESPLIASVGDGINWDSTLMLGQYYGGETVQYYGKAENLANGEIEGIYRNVITNSLQTPSCDDFQEIRVDGIDVKPFCETQPGIVIFTTSSGTLTFSNYETKLFNMELIFEGHVEPASYSIEAQII